VLHDVIFLTWKVVKSDMNFFLQKFTLNLWYTRHILQLQIEKVLFLSTNSVFLTIQFNFSYWLSHKPWKSKRKQKMDLQNSFTTE